VLDSAHDVSDGGIAVALAECCIANGVGCSVSLGLRPGRELAKLWSEEPSRVIVSFPAENEQRVQAEAKAAGVPFRVLGTTGGDELAIDEVLKVSVTALADAHRTALDPVVA